MKSRYEFAPISNQKAKIPVIQHHYLHRWQNASFCFGIVDTENANKIVGVLTVACPASWSLRAGAVGETKEESLRPGSKASHVFELNRLWVSDSVCDHCIESRFIAWCLRELKKIDPLIVLVSFADTEAGHYGTVYQASNWIYTGVVGGQKDKTKAGVFTRSRKHRYVWFADRARMRQMRNGKMKWKPLPYPKSVMKVAQERTQDEHSWQNIPRQHWPYRWWKAKEARKGEPERQAAEDRAVHYRLLAADRIGARPVWTTGFSTQGLMRSEY